MVYHRKLRMRAGLASVSAVLVVLSVGAASAFTIPFNLGSSDAKQERQAPAADVETRQTAQVFPSQNLPVQGQMAPASDTLVRLNQLEEQVRRLNGRVEELSFQLLQAQEQMRKQQEDNEFRFQDLESAKGGAGVAPIGKSGALEAPRTEQGSGDAEFAGVTPAPNAAPPAAEASRQTPIRQIIPNNGSTQLSGGATSAAPAAPSSDVVASIAPQNSSDLFALAYNYLLAGDYKMAEDAFRQYSQTYPDAKDVADAQYWLGESLFAQNDYTDAAEVFLNAQKRYPKSRKAPEMLLKLGMSLARLDNADTACATYDEVTRRYPNLTDNVKRKLKDEKSAARCSQRG